MEHNTIEKVSLARAKIHGLRGQPSRSKNGKPIRMNVVKYIFKKEKKNNNAVRLNMYQGSFHNRSSAYIQKVAVSLLSPSVAFNRRKKKTGKHGVAE